MSTESQPNGCNGSSRYVKLYTGIISAVIGAAGLVVAHNFDLIKFRSPGAFGSWQSHQGNQIYEVGKTYRAESDGFVAVYTHGKGLTRKFRIKVGKRSDALTTITRAGSYEGTVCPIPSGNYWSVVEPDDGGIGDITVNWLSVNTVDK